MMRRAMHINSRILLNRGLMSARCKIKFTIASEQRSERSYSSYGKRSNDSRGPQRSNRDFADRRRQQRPSQYENNDAGGGSSGWLSEQDTNSTERPQSDRYNDAASYSSRDRRGGSSQSNRSGGWQERDSSDRRNQFDDRSRETYSDTAASSPYGSGRENRRGGSSSRSDGGGRGGGWRDTSERTQDYRSRDRDSYSSYSSDRSSRDRDSSSYNNDAPSYGSRDRDNRRGASSDAQNKAPGVKDLWIGDVLYGVSPVLAALQAGRRKIYTLYVQEGLDAAKRKDKSAVDAAVTTARSLGATVTTASKHDLNMIADNRPHQGLILDCSPLDFESMDSMPDMRDFTNTITSTTSTDGGYDSTNATTNQAVVPLWLCLDEVMDPQNFGAALRSAYFLGASGVLTCRRNSSPLSAVVSKASAGAMELAPVHSCRSLPSTLEEAKTRGWQIIGAAAEDGAVTCSSFTLDKPSIVVLGNEGYGLRTMVKRTCDVLLQIEGDTGSGMGGKQGVGAGGSNRASQLVDSLNVSVATGILLHQLIASRR